MKAHSRARDGLIKKATACGDDRHPRDETTSATWTARWPGRRKAHALQLTSDPGITKEIMQVALAQAKERDCHLGK